MLDASDFVSECSGENIFMIKDNVLITPRLDSVLPGITRDSIMQIAKAELNLKIIEKNIYLQELFSADECFLTGTAAELTPVRQVDNHTIGSGKPGLITKQLQSLYSDIIHGKNKDYLSWLDFVD